MPKSTPPRSFFLSLRFYKREKEVEGFYLLLLLLLLFFVKPHEPTLRTYILRPLSGAAEVMKKPPGCCHTWAKGFASLLCCASRSKSRT